MKFKITLTVDGGERDCEVLEIFNLDVNDTSNPYENDSVISRDVLRSGLLQDILTEVRTAVRNEYDHS